MILPFAGNIVLFIIVILKFNLIQNDYICIPFKHFFNKNYKANIIEKFPYSYNSFIYNGILILYKKIHQLLQ